MRGAVLFVSLAIGLAACSSRGEVGAVDVADAAGDQAPARVTVRSIWRAPDQLASLAGLSFFDHPWPSDARRDATGKLSFAGWPNPRNSQLLASYIAAVPDLVDGFSPAAAGWLRFDGALDPASLPSDPGATLSPDASVQLIDVDPSSPELGTRRPITMLFRRDEGVYWPAHTLAFSPTFGYPLAPHTRYALVVTDGVRAEDGGAVGPDPTLSALLTGTAPEGALSRLAADWKPAVDVVAQAGVSPEHVVQLAVYTTGDPVAELDAVRDHARKGLIPAADPSAWKVAERTADYRAYEGVYGPSPNYQHGKLPFENPGDGGGFVFDANGEPVVADTFSLRFVLAVPDPVTCPMPPSGYPIVLHAHGTGGDYRSHFGPGTAPAAELARRCVASMGVDQIFHGTRPGAPRPPLTPAEIESREELLFFNFENVVAVRTNARQSAIDEVQRARLFTEGHLVVPAGLAPEQPGEVRFDPAKVLFFGHSQGGLNGPLYLSIDDSSRGGVLSGSSSVLSITLLQKTQPPPNVSVLVKTLFLGLRADEAAEVGPLHPAIGLAQTIVDATDPIHYVGRIVRAPRPGFAAKSIYQTEGVNPDGHGDSYAPPHGIEVQAVATGLPVQTPVIHPIDEARWTPSLAPVAIPANGLSGNLANGTASGVLAQWPASQASDGHFVVFDIPRAADQAAEFCKALAADPRGKVPAP